jgi:hypothetical protein
MPRIVARVSEQHQQLASFMEYRAFLQTIDFEP